MLDYGTLKFIWWLFVGLLLVGFAIMDGHDMGVGTLLPFVARGDEERRVVINTVGPHWDGNQVWFITSGGAIFAAWPLVYATAFSGLYWALLTVLWALFLRPVGFDYRSKLEHPRWRQAWDLGLCIGATVPPLVFGLTFGNLLQGLPFDFDDFLVPRYGGTFWQLLNPFALLAAGLSSAMITLHGATYLAHRTEGAIQARAIRAALYAGLGTTLAFLAAGLWLRWGNMAGYVITSAIDPAAVADPLAKTVGRSTDAWWTHYRADPRLWLLPALGLAGGPLAAGLALARRTLAAFVASALTLVGVIGTAGVSLFPFILPSSSRPQASLTVWDSVSSPFTLGLMFWATVLLLPLIVLYTGWAYRVMRGKVTVAHIRANSHAVY